MLFTFLKYVETCWNMLSKRIVFGCVFKVMPMASMSAPQSSPCPTPAMQGHSQSTGPKPWSDGECVLKWKVWRLGYIRLCERPNYFNKEMKTSSFKLHKTLDFENYIKTQCHSIISCKVLFWEILFFFKRRTRVPFLCKYHTVIITIFSVSSSGWWRSRECSEAPDPCCQWTSISCTTPGLRCASCTNGRQLSGPSASGSAGILHAPDAAETESHHTGTETPGFGPSGNPTRERV